ncbi:hypothetical protein [Sphingomonas sp. URHD0057]|uniref:hypothetical protein n=1 Tax=Sphingomonas sp. URHD0057 TaxID=1380389 RepID=UPI0004905C06|nr:hypothetical protein [Sphingomonas sp. URHD0057]
MIVVIALLAAASQSMTCVPYVHGERELTLGAREYSGKRYSSAYRHYASGLKVIHPLAVESAGEILGLKDDSHFAEVVAEDDARAGRYRTAAKILGRILTMRLQNIHEVHRCH